MPPAISDATNITLKSGKFIAGGIAFLIAGWQASNWHTSLINSINAVAEASRSENASLRNEMALLRQSIEVQTKDRFTLERAANIAGRTKAWNPTIHVIDPMNPERLIGESDR